MEIVKSIYDLAATLVFFGAVGAYVAAYVALFISLSRLLLKPEKKPEKKEKQIWNHWYSH
jgi:hypothetical protein